MKSSHNGSPNGRSKPGPKPKIDDAAIQQVYAILAVSGSLNDAADYLSIDRMTINRKLTADPRFAKGVDRAIAKGKLRLMNKIGKAEPWQAAAWMLERKWGAEFGRKEAVTINGNVQHTHEHELVQNAITDPATVRLAEALNSRMAHDACGNGQPPSSN